MDLLLMVHSHTLMDDCVIQVVTDIRTDMAGKRAPVCMVKERRKDRHALDPQVIGFKKTIPSNDRLLSSVDILVFAEPSPYLAESLIKRFVCSVSVGIISSTRRRSGETCALRDWWNSRRLSGYRRYQEPSR